MTTNVMTAETCRQLAEMRAAKVIEHFEAIAGKSAMPADKVAAMLDAIRTAARAEAAKMAAEYERDGFLAENSEAVDHERIMTAAKAAARAAA